MNTWQLRQEKPTLFIGIAGFTGERSFTAWKEPSKKGKADYWYGYRKVEGK